MPVHVGIIMDGNGRWAKKRGLPRTMGHRAGGETFRKIVDSCRNMGVKYVTCYTFSTENWKRPREEVDALMELFVHYLDEVDKFKGKRSRIIFLGDKSPFPEALKTRMERLERESAPYDNMTLMLAMNYGGRDDILHAARVLGQLCADGDITPEDIDEKTFSGMLYTGSAPAADLIIRTGGEQRISNFLLWQCAYAELYFTDVLWPDFSEKELIKAFEVYSGRDRRFGGVRE